MKNGIIDFSSRCFRLDIYLAQDERKNNDEEEESWIGERVYLPKISDFRSYVIKLNEMINSN